MQVNIQQLSPVLVEFQVEIPAAVVKTEVDKAYVALQKSARVRGFRPGKAPRDVLTHLYGDGLLADVGRKLVDETLQQALSEKNVQPISQPAIEPQKLSSSKSFQYKARFEVRPRIENVDYEGFEVKKPSTAVTPEMIDAELARLQREHSTLVAPSPERPAIKGDVLSIAFQVEVNGKTISEASTEGISVELGSGQFLREIDEALVGLQVGATKDVVAALQANHPNPAYRGKDATFHISVKEVKERRLPAIDDDFAKDVGTFENLEKLKEDLKIKVQKSLEQQAEDSIAEQIVLALCAKNPIPVPPSLVEQQCRLMEQEYVQQARRQGQQVRVDEELHARVHADSEMKVRAGLLMAEIAQKSQIRITEDDIEKGLAELAEQMGKQVAKLRVEYRDQKKREILIGMILEDKILDIIEAKAKITEA